MNVCATNLAKIGVLENQVKQYAKVMKEEMFWYKDGTRTIETEYLPLSKNHGKRGLGHMQGKANPWVEQSGVKAPKFVKGTKLYDALGRIHNSTPPLAQPRATNKKQRETRLPLLSLDLFFVIIC